MPGTRRWGTWGPQKGASLLIYGPEGEVAQHTYTPRRELYVRLGPGRDAWREILADPAAYAAAQPYPGALEAAQWLARRELLRGYVTTRPKDTTAGTVAWLKEWGFPDRPVVYDGGDRPGALRRLGASILVDDHPESVRLLDEGFLILMMDRPYNRHVLHPRLWRLGGWEGFLDLFRTIPLDARIRRDPLGWPEKKKGGYRGYRE